MYLTAKTSLFLIAFGLFVMTGNHTTCASDSDTVTLTIVPASGGGDDEYAIAGRGELPVGGKLVLKNSTSKTILATICYNEGSTTPIAIPKGGSKCIDIPSDPVLIGTSGTLKVESRCGSGSRRVKFKANENRDD